MKRVVIYMNDGKTDWVDHVVDVYETEDGDLVVYNDAYTYIYEKSQYDQYVVGTVDYFINYPLEEEKAAVEAELKSFYDNPIPEAMDGDLRWWIVNIASGAVTDDEIMSLVAIRDSFLFANARLEAENERMREVLSRVVNVLDGIGMIADDYQDISGIVRDWQKKSALSPSTDESEPTNA